MTSTTQPADTPSQSTRDELSEDLVGHEAKKGVHFDLPFDDDDDDSEQDQPAKPPRRRKRPDEPPFTPRAVFGLYLPRELVFDIGFRYKPKWQDKDRDNLSPGERKLLRKQGVLFASEYCLEKFPDIPLRWYHTIMAYAGDPLGLHPILVLGHMDSRKNVTVDVTMDDMVRMREELGLGDQQPEWYKILFMR